MFEKLLTNRKVVIYFCALLLILSIVIIKETRAPNCADAQTCVTIYPETMYWTASNSLGWSGVACQTVRQRSTNPFSRTIDSSKLTVALAGWELRYVGTDQWIRIAKAEIKTSTVILMPGQFVEFDFEVCLADKNSDVPTEYKADFIAFGWE